MKKIQTVIFDMDGLMIDTEKYYIQFFCEAAKEVGYKVTKEHMLPLRCLDSKRQALFLKEKICGDFDYDKVKSIYNRKVEKFFSENNIEVKKGLFALLDYLNKEGYTVAVATSTQLDRAHQLLKRIKALDYFDMVFSGENVRRNKPEPDIYIQAAAALGVEPELCLALEDSPNGVISASSAGCVTVMVPDLSFPDEALMELLYAEAIDLTKVIDILKEINT